MRERAPAAPRPLRALPGPAAGRRSSSRVASGAPERYLSTNNLRVVLAQTVIVALGAIGMTLMIVGGGIDLSVGSTIALTGVLVRARDPRRLRRRSLAVLAAVARRRRRSGS